MSTEKKKLDKELLGLYKNRTQFDRRNLAIDKVNKWIVFRENRAYLIDRYIALRKIQDRCEQIVKMIYVKKVFKIFTANIEKAK